LGGFGKYNKKAYFGRPEEVRHKSGTDKKDNNNLVQAAMVKNKDMDEIELSCYSKGKEKGIKGLTIRSRT